jgi:hypothetical protein
MRSIPVWDHGVDQMVGLDLCAVARLRAARWSAGTARSRAAMTGSRLVFRNRTSHQLDGIAKIARRLNLA